MSEECRLSRVRSLIESEVEWYEIESGRRVASVDSGARFLLDLLDNMTQMGFGEKNSLYV